MKTKSQLILTSILTATLLFSGSLSAQQPVPKPFELTHYEKRIPADAWMLFSMNFNVFLKSKEFMKAIFNQDGVGVPPKELVDLMTSGKVNVIMPYPILFGVGGDATKPGNAADQNPALVDFLKNRHHLGAYFNAAAMPDEIVSVLYKKFGKNLLIKEDELLKIVQEIKANSVRNLTGIDFGLGKVTLENTSYYKIENAEWVGKGVPKVLLDSIPNQSAFLLGFSLKTPKAIEMFPVFLKQMKSQQAINRIFGQGIQPEDDYDQMGKQINEMAQKEFGMGAVEILNIFKGDFVISVGNQTPNLGNENGNDSELTGIIAVTVNDEDKLTKLIETIESKNWLPEDEVKLVRRPGVLFLCTPNLSAKIAKGPLEKPLDGLALKAIKENHFALVLDFIKLDEMQRELGMDLFPAGRQFDFLYGLGPVIATGKHKGSKLHNRLVINFRDPKLDTASGFVNLMVKLVDLVQANLQKPAQPAKPVDATGKVGKIVNVDEKRGSMVLNRGSAHGFKVGDKFNVFRNNKLIGRIEVTFLSKTNTRLSLAQPSEGLGVPAGAQFRAGDDLVIVN